MIKSSYMMGSRLVIFVKGTDLESPQVFQAVNEVAFNEYAGRFSDVIVIGEDQSSKVFEGR